MTERTQAHLQLLKSQAYKKNRTCREISLLPEEEDLPALTRSVRLFQHALAQENPWFLPEDQIGFHRSNSGCYEVIGADGIKKPVATMGNLIPDYEKVLQLGMDGLRQQILQRLQSAPEAQIPFLQAALETVDTAVAFARRTAEAAKQAGAAQLYACLCHVPLQPPRTLQEACVLVKFLIFTLRCNRMVHLPLGRFDHYMRPFYEADRKAGKTREQLLETVEEFFLSLNFDSDLYIGLQLGDDGQSLVLGGNGSFDDFSQLCMEASMELNLINPKINLRVDKTTPDSVLELATLMTKQGLGFPQYCNDDVVIPGLIRLGYAPEDAKNYAVAACWEFIIPGKGADIPNKITMNFPAVINRAVFAHLQSCHSFAALMEKVKEELTAECDRLMEFANRRVAQPSPYLSVFVEGCVEKGRDITEYSAIYNNIGCHGAGIATAADSLAAIWDVIYETGDYTKKQLLDALEADFEGWAPLRNRLLSCPKMGCNDPRADKIGYVLLETFAGYLNGKPNAFGGIFRAGTGSAQEYWFSAQGVGATADGRHAHQSFGCSFSPSLEARLSGPISCIQSFTGLDLSGIINGGPLTMELHHTVFRNAQGIQKVAQLVKAFIHLGGHQLQLNSINRDRLLDAMEHPENHRDLIVRVWGWSGYFTELDRPFREHILKRTEFAV